jgi:3-hydroxyisobutyrate dehydrogenase-like beta-hydroxyacid dehydrogenase
MESRMNNRMVGLIGLGLMGRALGERLIASGSRVLGHDVANDAAVTFRERGGIIAPGAAEIFAACDIVLLSLPSDVEVRQVLQEAAGPFRHGQIILDTTTGGPDSTLARARELGLRHVHYLDATISGSSEQARQGQALWMVGGDRQAFDRCADLFRILTSQVIHTGPSGTGAQMKLVTNLVLGLNRAALAEGLAFAGAFGLDLKQTLEVLRTSMAYSRIMDTKGEKMIERDFQPQARLSQHLKDVRLMLEAAAHAGLTLPLTATHRRLMEQAEAVGLGDLDNSAIIEVLRKPPSAPKP